MAKEIEHKYVVINDSYREMSYQKQHIVQGYLCRDVQRTIRLRRKGEKAYLTIKGKNIGDTRLEFEYEIGISDFEAMLEMCDGRIIDKTRYLVEFEGYRWEVDEFHKELDGLTVAEIELSESHHDYPLPPFVGEDVTGNPAYYNSNL